MSKKVRESLAITVLVLLFFGLVVWAANTEGQSYTAPQANFTLPKNGGTPVAGGGGSTPTGTGFTHITGGVQDGAAKLVDTADVNPSQITYAKVQNVSATARLLGRSTAGAGVIEELTATSPVAIAGGAVTCSTCIQTLNKTTTDFTFSNSAAEQTIYSFSIPGGTLGTTSAVRLTLDSVFLNNTGGQRTFTLRVKYGATTLFQEAVAPINASATVNIVAPLRLLLHADGASTSAQRFQGEFSVGDGNTGAPAAGYGNVGAAPSFTFRPFGGTAAEDSTANKTLAVTVQFDAATATQTWHTRSAFLELIP
jgi:hypothetical protein